MLKRMGYRADMVADGIEVLQALERQPYDLSFMDITPSGATSSALKLKAKKVPVVQPPERRPENKGIRGIANSPQDNADLINLINTFEFRMIGV